jgi:hypothetical protein
LEKTNFSVGAAFSRDRGVSAKRPIAAESRSHRQYYLSILDNQKN